MPLVIIPNIPVWQLALFACNLLAFLALLARIVSSRLVKSHPALVIWLGVNIGGCVVPWVVRMRARSYGWFYICAEGLTLVLYLFMVLELYSKVLRNLASLATIVRWAIPAIVTASAIGGASLLALEQRPVFYLDWLFRVDRTVITSLVLFVLMITAFMVWFSIRVSRNTVVYSVGYAVYLVPKGASLLLMNSGHGTQGLSGVVGMTMSSLCLLFWAACLNHAGERAIVSHGGMFHAHDEARLITQLESINRSLLSASRK
jgi:hypothetical protein